MIPQNIVDIAITTDSAKVSAEGFGIPIILSPTPAWVERTRSYEQVSDAVADGFGATTPEYKMLSALLSQENRPERVIIGRVSKPTQTFRLTPTAVNLAVYAVKVDGTRAVYTADAAATVAEITAGLKAAIDALAVAGVTTVDAGTHLDVNSTLGAFHSLEIDADTSIDRLALINNTNDPGLAADLDAIKLETDDFYAVLWMHNSKAAVLAIAAWCETNDKLLVYQTQDTNTATTVESGATDVFKALKDLARTHALGFYHQRTDAFLDGGLAGLMLPTDPGSETWNLKTVSGVEASALTATHKNNIEAKNGNYYVTVAGVNVTQPDSKVASGEYVDVIRFIDWLEARISEAVFSLLANNLKVPYTDEGAQMIAGEVRGVLIQGVEVGGLSNNPEPEVTVPKVADIPSADRAARLLRTVRFSGTLAGAIHSTTIRGNVSV